MKSQLSTLLLSIVLITSFIGCGAPEEEILLTPPEISEATQPDAIYHLVYSDTISTDLTADYGIFLVDDIDASSTGLLAILDGAGATVTVIDSTGTAISAGGEGSGPGEFLWPIAVSISPDGIVAVSDYMGGNVRIYHPGLEYYMDIGGFIMANPGAMFVTDLETFTGMRIYFRTEGDETLIGHQTALWSGTDSEPKHIYTEAMRPFNLNDFGATIVSPYPMACNSEGDVFVADISIEDYILTSYTTEGEILWQMEMPFEKIEKTEDEIDIEQRMVQRRMEQSAHQMDFTPDPYHFAVISLALGPEGRLWAEIPGHENAFFNVFDQSSGEYLFSVESTEQYERLEVTPGGIFAVPEGDIPALLKLQLELIEE